MTTLRGILSALGGGGAVRNVERELDRRADEEHAVEALIARVSPASPGTVSTAVA